MDADRVPSTETGRGVVGEELREREADGVIAA